MKFNFFDPTPCGFPKPKVSLLPVLGRSSLVYTSSTGNSVFEFCGKDKRYYTRGRYALYAAYALAGVGPSGALLAPAYHCRTMLDPAIRLGANVVLYPVNRDLTPNIGALRNLLASKDIHIKAMLVTHYFGMPQQLVDLKRLCNEFSVSLIEDCAHSIPVGGNANLVGNVGNYAVFSPYKFFPSGDGGLLIVNDSADELHKSKWPTKSPRIFAEAKWFVESIINYFRGPNRDIDINLMETDVSRLCAVPNSPPYETQCESYDLSRHYIKEQENCSGLILPRCLIKHTNITRLVQRRRENFQFWIRVVSKLPHCRAVFQNLPEGVVPYMFPLYIDYPNPHFYFMKMLGVPIWRWDEMAVSDCPVASDYRTRLLHLPCHQELTSKEMEWMSIAITNVIQKVPVDALWN